MRLWRFIVPVVVAGLLAGACGSSKPKAPAAIPVYTITAREPVPGQRYAFDVPTNMKGGVITLRLHNAGKEQHDFQLIKQTAGHTLDDVVKIIASENATLPTWLQPVGGVGSEAPGTTTQATLNLPPGSYWYVCTESSDKGVSHASHGMKGELTVAGTSGAKMPTATASIEEREYTFITSGLHAGTNNVEVRDVGKQLHMAAIFPLLPGKTLADARKSLTSQSQSGPPPVDFSKAFGASVLSPGGRMVVPMTFEAHTNYVMLCFMPDYGTSGPPHFAKGMLVEVKIA